MTCELMKFVIAFAPLFSKPVFHRVKVLLQGAILAPASRTVTNALRVMGFSQEKHFQNYHRVLGRAEWSCLAGSKILLNLLIKAFGLSDEIVIGFDDTVERRRGKQIKAKGIYRDAVRREQVIFCQNKWFEMALVYAVDRGRVCQKGVGIAVYERLMSVGKIRFDAPDSASEIDGPRPASDFIDQAVAAAV